MKEEEYKTDWEPHDTMVADSWTLDPDAIMAWFKKWFGDEQ